MQTLQRFTSRDVVHVLADHALTSAFPCLLEEELPNASGSASPSDAMVVASSRQLGNNIMSIVSAAC